MTRSICLNAREGRRIGPTLFPDNPMVLDHCLAAYAGDQPVMVPMFELEVMVPKMPMRSTHGSLDPVRGPRVYQPTRLPLHRQLPSLRLPLQR